MMNEMNNFEIECDRAFTEVSEILKLMPTEITEKIPKKFKEMIEKEKSLDYHPNIKEPIKDEDISEITIIIMGFIYRDFIASNEEKIKLQKKDEKEIKNYYETRYSADNIFKNKAQLEEKSIVEYKEPIFKRMLKKLKELFNLK